MAVMVGYDRNFNNDNSGEFVCGEGNTNSPEFSHLFSQWSFWGCTLFSAELFWIRYIL